MRSPVKISIIDAEYGGVESRGYRLLTTSLILGAGENFHFLVLQDRISGRAKKAYANHPNVKTIIFPVKNKGIAGRLLFSFLTIFYTVLFSDVVLLLGVNSGIFLPFARIFSRLKIVVNIDSLRWNRQEQGTLRQMIWKTVERLAVKFSHIIICSNQQLKNYAREEYKVESIVINYGGDFVELKNEQVRNELPPPILFPDGKKFILCRTYFSPSSRVEVILETFARYPRYGIVMMGNWAETTYGKNLYAQYRQYENVRFMEYEHEVYTTLLSRSEVFLFNFDAGGTHISLLEAMYQTVPVIALDSAINREITQNKAFYFSHSTDLGYILHSTNASMFRNTAANLAKIASEQYLWSKTVIQYFHLIEHLVSQKKAVPVTQNVRSGVQRQYADDPKGQ